MGKLYVPYNKERHGFFVDVVVDNTFLVKQKLSPTPPPYKTKALVDTGASLCGASERIIEKLGFPTSSKNLYKISTGNGTMMSHRYYGAFSITEDKAFGSVCCTLNRLRLESDFFEFVIGMNVLDRWGMSYSPKEQGIWLEFPAV